MSLASVPFLLMVISTSAVYSLLPRSARPWMLLFVSLAFYGSFNWSFLILLIGVVLFSYLAAFSIRRFPKARWQKPVWILTILSPLAFYKYLLVWFPDALHRVVPVSGLDFGAFGKVLIPVGLSFFTFQCLGYVLDVSRGYHSPEKNLARFALFVSFFPQILAGPIGRWAELSDQIRAADRPSPDMVLDGLLLIAYGLFLKSVLGDWLGFYVDTAYAAPASNTSAFAFLGLYGFALQLYADFCGYSLIALGSARLFGIRLIVNFKQPFFARSIGEFWQRWHISLTRWVGDYIYRPLALAMVKRKLFPRRVQEALALLLTWTAMGLWHGPYWTFVAFGVVHAALIYASGPQTGASRRRPSRLRTALGVLLTFHLVVFTFGLIRSASLADYVDLLGAAFAFTPGRIPFTGVLFNVVLALLVVGAVDFVQRFRPQVQLRSLALRTASIAALLVLVLLLGHDEGRTFIYFRF